MKKRNWKKKLIIVIAFIIGLVAGFAARRYLPLLLPANLVMATNLLAILIQLLVSVAVILLAIFVFKVGRD